MSSQSAGIVRSKLSSWGWLESSTRWDALDCGFTQIISWARPFCWRGIAMYRDKCLYRYFGMIAEVKWCWNDWGLNRWSLGISAWGVNANQGEKHEINQLHLHGDSWLADIVLRLLQPVAIQSKLLHAYCCSWSIIASQLSLQCTWLFSWALPFSSMIPVSSSYEDCSFG